MGGDELEAKWRAPAVGGQNLVSLTGPPSPNKQHLGPARGTAQSKKLTAKDAKSIKGIPRMLEPRMNANKCYLR